MFTISICYIDTINPMQIPDSFEALLEANSLKDYLISMLIIVGSIVVIGIVRKVLKSRQSKTKSIYIQYIFSLDKYIFPILYLLPFFIAYQWLTIPEKGIQFLNYVFTISFIVLTIRLIAGAVTSAIRSYFVEHDESGSKLKQIRGIVLILNALLWIIGLIFLFDNLGFNVTAVLTGLGVGGIAIALAAQTILGDLFNYFVIFFDRPFELGDFIIVDDKLGTVEYIGLKTTRLRSLQGEQVVFSNTNLTNSRIHNYKRMSERRIVFKLQVVYETSPENLQSIPNIIRSVIEQQSDTRFDRAHFANFGEYSFTFEVVYYILSADYNRYMDIQQKINLLIVDAFIKKNIRFAIPAYTVNLKHRHRKKIKMANEPANVTRNEP